ncbi:calcium-binding protein [Variovorax sp. J31P179]|uniref:calcium-binding protein n=1 Tax=Variovorax sp. J31P179 TaxID=3053508 RepID=UPI002574BC02|nr:calcium-binding protein [Variovorax sp. J31P179]MDM0081675.1 calcium-binding protein [Variovorax sp. J31P179]
MYGGAGDDRFDGGWATGSRVTTFNFDEVQRAEGAGGADTMSGGEGDDWYFVDNKNDVVIEYVGKGGWSYDRVSASVDYTLPEYVENLNLVSGSGAKNGTGNSSDNVLFGNELDNLLLGGAGNDLLQGGYGIDTLMGGTGNDIYSLNKSPEDIIVEYANEGRDQVQSYDYSYTLGANLEDLRLIGQKDVNGTGNELDNVISGAGGDNVLSGLAGDDTLNGGNGADTLIGGAGRDTFLFGLNGDWGKDLILDFKISEDQIAFSIYNPGLFSSGKLSSSKFKSGAGLTGGQDADDYIVYNTTTGDLYFDMDGSGSGAAICLAQCTTTPLLTYENFILM